MVKLNKCILARKTNSNKTVYLYPKTSADMVYFNENITAEDKIKQLETAHNNINQRIDVITTTPADSINAEEISDARIASNDNQIKDSLNARLRSDFDKHQNDIDEINSFILTRVKEYTNNGEIIKGYRILSGRQIDDVSDTYPNSTIYKFRVEDGVEYTIHFKGGEYRRFGFSDEEEVDLPTLESKGYFGLHDEEKVDVSYTVKNKQGLKYLYVFNTANSVKNYDAKVHITYKVGYTTKEWTNSRIKELIGNNLYEDTDIYSDFNEIKAANTSGTWNDNTYTHNNVSYSFVFNDFGEIDYISASTINDGLNGISKLALSVKYKFDEGTILKISGCPEDGGFIGYFLALCDGNGKVVCTDFGGGMICKIRKTGNYRLRIRFMSEADKTDQYNDIIFRPKLEYVTVQDQINEIKTNKRLTVAAWNCGNFIGGVSPDTLTEDFSGYSGEDYDDFIKNTAKMISSIHADIFGVCECPRYAYRDPDTNEKVYTDDALFNKLFANNYIIHKTETGHTGAGEVGILMHDKVNKFGQVTFKNRWDSSKGKQGSNKFTYAIYRINGKEIFIACAHLIHSIYNVEERKKEIDELTSYCEDYDDAIIFGDFNLHYEYEYDYLYEKGWESANGNIWGFLTTQKGFGNNPIEYPLDTIIIKGNLFISDFKVIDYRFSDHYPIVATIELL